MVKDKNGVERNDKGYIIRGQKFPKGYFKNRNYGFAKCKVCGKQIKKTCSQTTYCKECYHNKILEFNRKRNQERKDRYREYYRQYYHRKKKNNPKYKEKNLLRAYAYHYLRNEVFKRANYKCEKCGSSEELQLHHKRYSYDIKDIEALCRKCHDKIRY